MVVDYGDGLVLTLGLRCCACVGGWLIVGGLLYVWFGWLIVD